MARLFFALWPDRKVRQQIEKVLDAIPCPVGRKVVPGNIHITLVFLGSVENDMAMKLQEYACDIHVNRFSLSLDHTGWWKKQQVLWLAPSTVPGELRDLELQIKKVSNFCGIKLDDRPYKPHITLMRKATRAATENSYQTIHWNVTRFVLVESVTHPEGVRYIIKKTWELD